MHRKTSDVTYSDIIRVLGPGPDAKDGETVAEYLRRRRNRALERLEANPGVAGDLSWADFIEADRMRALGRLTAEHSAKLLRFEAADDNSRFVETGAGLRVE